jgi:prepilin-type processing-associated H-X9-DG protein
VATTNGGMTVAFVDGSVRFMSAQEFLRNTPTLQDLGMNLITNQCGFTGGTVRYDRNTPPNVRIDFPMWAFTP